MGLTACDGQHLMDRLEVVWPALWTNQVPSLVPLTLHRGLRRGRFVGVTGLPSAVGTQGDHRQLITLWFHRLTTWIRRSVTSRQLPDSRAPPSSA